MKEKITKTMDTCEFAITEEGLVYHWVGHQWIRLGHVSGIVRDESPIANRIRTWWKARLASAEPAATLVVPGGGADPYLQRAPEVVSESRTPWNVDLDLAANRAA
jgi:hypothetical protein